MCEIHSDDTAFGYQPPRADEEMKDCILIGTDASFEHMIESGDILFATPTSKLLISGNDIYLNGMKQSEINEECVQAIKKSLRMVIVGQNEK